MPIAISLFAALEALFFIWPVVSCKALNSDGSSEEMVGWVWDVGNRSTFDVLWSCLAVVLVCTYKVVHLNLPAEKEMSASWHTLWFWKKWLRKLKWMMFMALSPELLLSMATQDWLWCRNSVRKFQQAGSKDNSSLLRSSKPMPDIIQSIDDGKTMSTVRSMPSHVPLRLHAHYANMGGFIMSFPERDISRQSNLASQGRDALSTDASRIDCENSHQSIPLSAEQLLMLVEEFAFEIPYVSQEDIRDRSKADAFTKLFAIGQSSWLIVQCIARAVQSLPLTELELATMGFVGCALVMYLLWWDKPFDVEHSVTIYCPHRDRERVIKRLREIFEARHTSKFISPNWKDFLREQRIRNWAYMDESSLGLGHMTWLVSTLSIMGMGMAFSALHLTAWNWAFPSIVEKHLWQCAAVIATAASVPVAILLPLLGIGKEPWQRHVVVGFIYPLCGLYLLCRTILVVQIFLCFRSMPEGVYRSVDWAYFLPQLS